MANKRITDVDEVSVINSTDSLFINQNGTLKQIKKSNIPKPTYTSDEVGADQFGTATSKVSEHNTDTNSHNDVRLLIQDISERINALADSDDITLDQMSEIVAYIKNNKSLIDSITTSKVSVSDIIDNLTTNVSDRPLSAAQGVALKDLALAKTGDSENNIVSFVSNDSTVNEEIVWNDVDILQSQETHKSIFNKISTMFKNIRYLYKVLGTTDISNIGDGTVTGNISELNGKKVDKSSVVNDYMTTQEGFVADARALKDLNDRMGTPLHAVTSILLSKKDDWDSVNPGVYYFNTWAYEGGVNYPKGGMGVVIYLKSYDGTCNAQYCISDSWLGVRVCSNSKWGAWKYLALN